LLIANSSQGAIQRALPPIINPQPSANQQSEINNPQSSMTPDLRSAIFLHPLAIRRCSGELNNGKWELAALLWWLVNIA
jgi:hypothetical protein